MSENLPARRTPTSIQKAEGIHIMDWAKMIANSGMFGVKSMEEAMMKVAMGRDLGLSDTGALMGIHVVHGRPVLSAGVIATAIKRSGRYDYRVREKTASRCVVEFFEVADGKRESLGIEEFTMDDARSAQLLSNGTWKKYPKAMLFARALTSGYRTHCPDVFDVSVYDAEEMGEDFAPDEYIVLDDENPVDAPIENPIEDVADIEPRQPFEEEPARPVKSIRETVGKLRGEPAPEIDDSRKGGVRPRPDIPKPTEDEPVNPYAEAKARIKANPKCADPDEVISADTPYVKGRTQWYGQTLAECEEWQGMVASMAQKNPPKSERTKRYARTAIMLRNARKAPTAGVQKGTAARALSRADEEPGDAGAREVAEAWATWHLKETGGDAKALAESVMELIGCDIRDTGLDGIRQLGPKIVGVLASKVELGQGQPKARA